MLENGLDFLRSGLKYIGNPTSKFDLKYGVLHLSAGIELVLKDRLQREDWTQIFVKPANATKERLNSGDFNSVTLRDCLKRLEKHCSDNLPDEALLSSFKKQRNPIEHFAMNHSKEALEASAALALGQLITFISDAFEEGDLTTDEGDLLQEVRTQLAEFDQFTTTRIGEIQPLLDAHTKGCKQIVVCPSCMQDALLAGCDVRCEFCCCAGTAQGAAELYIATRIGCSREDALQEGDEYPLRNCPNCHKEALVFEEGYSEGAGICFVCGDRPSPSQYVSCDQCRALCAPEDRTGGMCPECFGHHISEGHR